MSQAERLREAVWSSSWSLLRNPLEATAEALGVGVFLVGGHVRDLLLDRTPTDFDLTVEGDGVEFATRLAEVVSGELRLSRRFLTAAIDLPGGLRVDVATARSESYERPGALPIVTPTDLRTDLLRRDFSVNTFALGLAATTETDVLSVEGAPADLVARELRILHPRSFLDDPTRILRAVRQEERLAFRLTADSERSAREAVSGGALSAVSGERLWHELEPLLSSPIHVAKALRRLESLQVLAGAVPGLCWSSDQEQNLEGASRELGRLVDAKPSGGREGMMTEVALLALASSPEEYLGPALAERFSLGRGLGDLLRAWPDRLEHALEAVEAANAQPSSVHAATRSLSLGALVFLGGLLDGPARDWVRRETIELRELTLDLRPADLLERGHRPGPSIGRALEQTLAARLDGEIGPQEELDYALGVLESLSSSSVPR